MSADAADVVDEAHIRGLEERRCLALKDGDSAGLGALLHPDFVYVHASGRTEDRTEYLTAIAADSTTYGDFTHRELAITMLGACALVGGVLSHSKTAGGNSRDLLFRFTAAWAAHASGEWQLLLWHNTKIVPFVPNTKNGQG
jgi:ketosteroid isomerase-like protein